MKIQFISSFSAITPDPAESRRLYIDSLGLPLDHLEGDDYEHSESIEGSKHFGVWPLRQAAEACFDTPDWPSSHPVPQASIEFEVEDPAGVDAAMAELEADGHAILHRARTEPWGQTVARLQSPEGLIVGISYAPWMHA